MWKFLDLPSLLVGAMVANGMTENQGLFKVVVYHMDWDLGEVCDRYVLRNISACF